MDNLNSDRLNQEQVKQYLKGIKAFYLAILRFKLNAVKHYWWLMLLGILAGGGYAWSRHQNTKPVYDGTASFTYSELHKKIYGEMVDKLRKLALTESYSALAEQLKITPKQAKTIRDIEAVNVENSPLSEDMTQGRLPFYVKIKLTDRSLADTLLVKLEAWMNAGPQAQKLVETNTQKMREKIQYLDIQLKKLDSMKMAYSIYMQHQHASVNPTVNTFNPMDMYTASEKYFNTRADLVSAVAGYKVVKILDGFVMTDRPYAPSLGLLLLKYAGIGLLITGFISLLLETFRRN